MIKIFFMPHFLTKNFFLQKILKFLQANKSFLINWSWLSLYRGVSSFLSTVIIIYVAREFGPKIFGSLNISYSILSLAAMVSTLKLDDIVIKEINENKDYINETLSSAIVIRFLGSVIMLLVLIFTVPLVYYENNEIYIYTILLAFIPFAQIANIFGYFFIAKKRSKDFAIPNIINSLIFFFIKILSIYFYKDIILFISISVIEAIVLSLVLYIKFSKLIVSFSFSIIFLDIKKILKKSIPLAIAASGFMLCTKIDLFMISKIIDIKTAGFYSVSTKINESFLFIFSTLLLSIFAQITSNKKLKYSSYFKKIFFSTILFSGIIYFFSENIIEYFFGFEYIDSVLPLKILTWSLLFFTLYAFMSQISLLYNKVSNIMYSTSIMLILNISLNYILIPKYLMEGAAASSLITLFIGCIILNFLIKKNVHYIVH